MPTIQSYIDGFVNGWGSEVKVIKPGGKVGYQKSKCYEDIKREYQTRNKARKAK